MRSIDSLPYDILLQIFEAVADLQYIEGSGDVGGGLEEWRRSDQSSLGETAALVCKSWTKPAQDILFRRIFIDGTSSSQITSLIWIMNNKPTLLDQVRCLHLGTIEQTITKVSRTLVRILSACKKVRRLEIDSLDSEVSQALLNTLSSSDRSKIIFFSSGLPPIHPGAILMTKALSQVEKAYWLLDSLSPSLSTQSNATSFLSLTSLTTLSITDLRFPHTLPLTTSNLQNFVLYTSPRQDLNFNSYLFSNSLRRFQYFTPISPTSASLLLTNLNQLEVLSVTLSAKFTTLTPLLDQSSSLRYLECDISQLSPLSSGTDQNSNFSSFVIPTLSRFPSCLKNLKLVVNPHEPMAKSIWEATEEEINMLLRANVKYEISSAGFTSSQLFEL